MSIRGLLFLLFLYVVLVWLVVFYVFSGAGFEEIVRRGVFWSAIGVGALMVWLIGERVFAWWRSRATRPAKPAVQKVSAASLVHEDDLAFARLIAEADASLSQAPGIGHRTVRDFPICLLIGTEGAGKTSLIQNSGIDSRLLAGQVAGSGAQVTSTRVANIWLANETVFVEIGGRILQSEPARFAEFLRVLGPPRQTSRWRRWLQDMQGGSRMPALRGVILCRDLRTCAAIPKNPLPTQDGQAMRDRIFAIASIFGIRCPVYTIFTRADAIPYFGEFFARFPARDEGHIWGALANPEEAARPPETGVWAEVETRRLNRDFGSLFTRLNERRILALSTEQLADRKPAIYEFPREFKRIRGALVQFLVDAMRPDPVALSPLPRGFFFTGVRRAERGAGGRAEIGPRTDATRIGAADPTVIFRPDTTQFLNAPLQGRGDLVDHWMFARDIFLEVLEKDRPIVQTQTVAPHARDRRLPALAWGAAGLASLMILIWAVSWNENRELINKVTETTEAFGDGGLGLGSLRALDNLRDLLQNQLDQSGRWQMHWGLYVGDKLRERARMVYFDRLRHMLLAQANIRLGEQLYHAETSRPNDPVYDWLKTYITTTSVGCPVDPPAVKKTLLDVIAEDHPDLDESSKALITRQIDYYASVLPQGLPVSLPANPDSIERSREHIRNQHGPRQVYEKLINEVKNGSAPLSLRDEIGEYESVLDAPKEIPFEFSIKGRDKFEQLAGSNKLPRGDTCVLGSSEGLKTAVADSDQIRQARAIYYEYYRDAWKAFLAGTKVKPFKLAEAAKRLDKLSDPTASPLLGLVRLVSRNTYFAPSKPSDSGLLDPVLPASIKQKRDQAAAKIAEANRPEFGPLEVSQIFQPAQWVVPPDSQSIHSEKNKPYVDALRNLGENADVYVKASSPSDQSQKLQALQDTVKQAKGAQRSLADGFNNNTEGVDTQLARILFQPIQFVDDGVPAHVADPLETNAGTGLKRLCSQILPLLREYPFNQNVKEAGLPEVQSAFMPRSGSIWQFQQSLGDLVKKTAADGWVQGENAKLKASSELLVFLNRAQQISDAFFPEGRLGFRYSLRPVPGQNFVSLTIDGKTLDSSKTSFETQFTWPASSEQQAGAVGISFTAEHQSESPFGKYGGWWGVFQLFRWADDREVARRSATVTWSKSAGLGGQPQPLKPPVRVDVADFPGGIDIFNPRFFTPPLGCPGRAVEPQ